MSYQSRRKQRADFVGKLLLTSVAIIFAGVPYLLYRLNSSKVATDPSTLCPQDGPRSIAVILLDTTDALDAVQKADVLVHLDNIKDGVPRLGELGLFSVAATGDHLLKVKMKMCNPGRGSEVNPLYGNPRMGQKKWLERFSNKTDEELNDLLQPHPADLSPILESIQQVALQAFTSASESVPKSLTIVSDMLQNTTELSQYRDIEPFEKFKQTPYYLKVRTDLSGVDVTILLLNRPQNGIGRRAKLIDFWEQYFTDAKVNNLRVTLIQG